MISNGESLLYFVVYHPRLPDPKKIELMKLLLAAGIDINATNKLQYNLIKYQDYMRQYFITLCGIISMNP